LQEEQISVPDQVQIFSFNDTSIASLVNPELSSVAVATVQMRETAVDAIQDVLTNPRHVAKKVILMTKLFFRQSPN